MKARLFAVVCGCALALCAGLLGCGAGDPANGAGDNSNESSVVGVWDVQNFDELMGMVELDDQMKAAVADIAAQICFMNFNEDGTMQFVAASEVLEGTWEQSSDSKLSLTLDGSEVTAALNGDTITFNNAGMTLVLTKAGDEPRAIPTEEEVGQRAVELATAYMGGSLPTAEGDDGAEDDENAEAESQDESDDAKTADNATDNAADEADAED